jgi:collagen type III alpha
MASVLPPPPPIVAEPRSEERLVDEQIRRTRRSLKLVDFFSGVLTLIIGVLVFLLFASVMEHWVIPGGWNGAGRVMLFVALLVGIGWYCWRTFWPLVSRAINPAYAAQLIERSTPSLKNSLLNFLLLRNRRQQLSQKVYQAIEQQAAQGLARVSIDSVVDRSVLLRLGYVLVAVVAICAIYRVLSPKNLTASMERVLLPWSNIAVPARVEILNVTPGDTEMARGESLEVSAEIMGLREGESVRVRYSTLDHQAVDRDVTLAGVEGTLRFQGRLPDRFSAGDSGGIQQDLEYWIEAGDAKSEKYRVTVFARPTLVVEKIRYQFPRYTGLPPREAEGTGDVSALEGTQVSVYALANHDIATASIDFNADGRHDLPMSADKMKATAQFTLELQDDRRTPKYDSYVLQYKTTNGRSSSLPPKYNIDVTPDYAPEVKIVAPVDDEGKLVEQLDVPVDTAFTIEVEARDPDFALKSVVLLGEVAGEEMLKHDLLTKEQAGKFVGRMTATPKELNLKPDDVMEYSVAAVDNREPEPNITRTEKLRIRVVGPPQFGGRPQGQQQQGEGQQDGESGEGGQGQEGMQGPGEAGGSGEKGEQQGEGGQAGGEGQQQGEPPSSKNSGAGGEEQNGKGDPAGEKQGRGDQAGGENQENQSGQQSSQQDNNPSEGQEAGGQQQDGAGEQGKVSAEGDSDGEAFDKMTDHFAEQDADSQGQGQSSKAGGETEQRESQDKNESGQGDGQSSPDEQQPTAESGRNQDQGIDGAQEGEESAGSGAEGQPNEQREQQGEPPTPNNSEAGGDKGDKGEKQEAPGGEMSTEQGEQGSGNNPGENEGSMDTDAGRKSHDKSDKGPDSELNDNEAPGQSNSQQESDSRGGQGGDNSGGGQEGAGQQADAEGTGAAGENTAADDGAGQAAEQGAGENSSQAGQQGESDKPTGESSETKPGAGSKESDQPGGNKPGGEQPGEPQSSKNSEAGGEQQPDASGEPALAGGEQDQQPEQSPENGSPSGNPGQQSPSGGTGGNPSAPPPAGELEPGDAANLDYATKQTDLVLDRLEEQLEKQSVDKKLLEKLGWTEDELRRFVERWKSLKAEAEAAPSEDTKQQLDNALRSLGLNPNRRTGYQSNVTKEKLRQLQDSYRGQIPLEYADQVRAYIKGTATAAEEKAE